MVVALRQVDKVPTGERDLKMLVNTFDSWSTQGCRTHPGMISGDD